MSVVSGGVILRFSVWHSRSRNPCRSVTFHSGEYETRFKRLWGSRAENVAERWLKNNEGPDGHQCPERGRIGFGRRSAETSLTFSCYLQRVTACDVQGERPCFQVSCLNVDKSGVGHRPTAHPTAPGVEVIEGPHDLRRTQNEFSTDDKR